MIKLETLKDKCTGELVRMKEKSYSEINSLDCQIYLLRVKAGILKRSQDKWKAELARITAELQRR